MQLYIDRRTVNFEKKIRRSGTVERLTPERGATTTAGETTTAKKRIHEMGQ